MSLERITAIPMIRLLLLIVVILAIGCSSEHVVDSQSNQAVSVDLTEPDLTQIGILEKLPPELTYLVEPAIKYGRYHFDEHIFAFLDLATEVQKDELRSTAATYVENDHQKLVDQFWVEYATTDYPRSADLYFLFMVIDYGNFWPDTER